MNLLVNLQELLFICVILIEIEAIDYCTIKTCKEGEHTMCKYPEETVACAGDEVKAGLTEELRKAILDRHNFHRKTVALGKQANQPRASNMMKLTWHEEAEKIAQRWANQCIPGHDKCKNLEKTNVGQNFAAKGVSLTSPDVKGAIVEMVDMWYNEVKHFNKEQIDSFKFVSNIGHYTQVVWAESTAIGCGFIQLAPKGQFRTFNLVCNYVPAGNYLNSRIYKKGKPCSECPKSTQCSKSYPGLCTKDESDFGGEPDDVEGDVATSLKSSVFIILSNVIFVFGSYSVIAA